MHKAVDVTAIGVVDILGDVVGFVEVVVPEEDKGENKVAVREFWVDGLLNLGDGLDVNASLGAEGGNAVSLEKIENVLAHDVQEMPNFLRAAKVRRMVSRGSLLVSCSTTNHSVPPCL